jgi:hypothetical protein
MRFFSIYENEDIFCPPVPIIKEGRDPSKLDKIRSGG